MADFSRFRDNMLYRRAKYAVFLGFIALISIPTVLMAWSFFAENVPNLLNSLFQFIHSKVQPETDTLQKFFTLLMQPPTWVVYWLLAGAYLITFRYWRLFILGGLGKIIVAVLRLNDSGRFASGGNARFAGMFEEYQAKKTSGIYYGRSLFSRFWFMYDNDDRHMLTIAGARSGKGACAIIPNLLEWQGSVLCIDPKGTNTHVTAKWRRKILQNTVHVIDPFNMIPDEDPAFFNPLDILDPESLMIVEDVRLISEALVPAEADGKNAHFTESAKVLLDGYIVHVVTSGDYPNPSLIDVFNIVNLTASDAIDIHAKMMMNTSCGGLAQQAAARVLDSIGTNEFNSVVATLKTNLKWLASEAFRKTLSRSSFFFDQMKDSKISLYLVIPPDMLTTHKRFLRLFINIAASRYTRGGKARRQGLFIIDECPALGYMEEIAKIYGELASYNLIMWTFFQDKGQLDELYGARGETFIGSSRAVQVFSIRSQDAEWVASMIGTRGKVSGDEATKTTEIKNFRDAGSIETEIGGKAGLQYILRAGLPPMILERKPYFNSFHFQAMTRADPDHPGKNFVQSFMVTKQITQGLGKAILSLLRLPYAIIGEFITGISNSIKTAIKDPIGGIIHIIGMGIATTIMVVGLVFAVWFWTEKVPETFLFAKEWIYGKESTLKKDVPVADRTAGPPLGVILAKTIQREFKKNNITGKLYFHHLIALLRKPGVMTPAERNWLDENQVDLNTLSKLPHSVVILLDGKGDIAISAFVKRHKKNTLANKPNAKVDGVSLAKTIQRLFVENNITGKLSFEDLIALLRKPGAMTPAEKIWLDENYTNLEISNRLSHDTIIALGHKDDLVILAFVKRHKKNPPQ